MSQWACPICGSADFCPKNITSCNHNVCDNCLCGTEICPVCKKSFEPFEITTNYSLVNGKFKRKHRDDNKEKKTVVPPKRTCDPILEQNFLSTINAINSAIDVMTSQTVHLKLHIDKSNMLRIVEYYEKNGFTLEPDLSYYHLHPDSYEQKFFLHVS